MRQRAGRRTCYVVQPGSYSALVPSAGQLETDAGQELPGGFAALRNAGIETVELRIDDEEVTFLLDGTETATRRITDRVQITDSEGSGPFKAEKEILVLDSDPSSSPDSRLPNRLCGREASKKAR